MRCMHNLIPSTTSPIIRPGHRTRKKKKLALERNRIPPLSVATSHIDVILQKNDLEVEATLSCSLGFRGGFGNLEMFEVLSLGVISQKGN